ARRALRPGHREDREVADRQADCDEHNSAVAGRRGLQQDRRVDGRTAARTGNQEHSRRNVRVVIVCVVIIVCVRAELARPSQTGGASSAPTSIGKGTSMEATLEVKSRDSFGKNEARRTRRAGLVPGVLYGGEGSQATPIS